MFEKCEFCEKWIPKSVNFVNNEIFYMWISEKVDFQKVNFVKNEILKMWILWKMRLWKDEFCEKWYTI